MLPVQDCSKLSLAMPLASSPPEGEPNPLIPSFLYAQIAVADLLGCSFSGMDAVKFPPPKFFYYPSCIWKV